MLYPRQVKLKELNATYIFNYCIEFHILFTSKASGSLRVKEKKKKVCKVDDEARKCISELQKNDDGGRDRKHG